MITRRYCWRIDDGGYVHNPHFLFYVLLYVIRRW